VPKLTKSVPYFDSSLRRVCKCSELEWRESHGEMWVHQFMTLRISLLLFFSVYCSMLIFININLYSCNCIFCTCNCICIVFIVCSCVLYCVCSFVCCVSFEHGVIFCVMCVICVLWLIVVSLPPGKTPFTVKINK
jgi:hypothetical protein